MMEFTDKLIVGAVHVASPHGQVPQNTRVMMQVLDELPEASFVRLGLPQLEKFVGQQSIGSGQGNQLATFEAIQARFHIPDVAHEVAKLGWPATSPNSS